MISEMNVNCSRLNYVILIVPMNNLNKVKEEANCILPKFIAEAQKYLKSSFKNHDKKMLGGRIHYVQSHSAVIM